MSDKAFPDLAFRTGAARSADILYVLAESPELTEDEVPHTVVLAHTADGWVHHELRWSATIACIVGDQRPQLLAMSESGESFRIGGGELVEASTSPAGLLRRLRNVGGVAHAVGTQGTVLRRVDADRWEESGVGLTSEDRLEDVVGLEPDLLYAVGWRGNIYRFDGQEWRREASPTNVILTSVTMAVDGTVWACGQEGVIVRGREGTWEVFEHDDTDADFWDIISFEGQIFVSTLLAVYRITPNGLEYAPVEEQPESTYHLTAAEGRLWSIGYRDIVVYDGDRWSRIE